MQHKNFSRIVFPVAMLFAASVSPASAHAQAIPGPRQPGDLNLAASRVYIFVDKTGFGHQHAIVGRLQEGNMHLAGRAAGRLVFDLASFKADTPGARRYIGLKGEENEKAQHDVTDTMQGADVLDVARFPTAKYEIDSFRQVERRGKSDKLEYRIEGKFTLHGTTHPLRFVASAVPERGHLHLKGSFRLRQTDYNITPYKKALGTVGVADVLTVYGEIWLKQ